MYYKFLLAIILAVAYTKAQNNDLCECESGKGVKENENLWEFLKRLEKLASQVPEERKVDYAALPGNLYQLGCNCEDEMRKKREADFKIELPEDVEIEEDTVEVMEEVREKRHLIQPNKMRPIDLRCPLGTYWLPHAHTCVPLESEEE